MIDANSVWMSTLQHLVGQDVVAPRGKSTRELLGFQTRIDMHSPIVTVEERKLGYKFMFGEAFWILSGDNRVETIAPYSKAISNFSDDGYTFFGAYGPKILMQLPYVIRALRDDEQTRQAVMVIWRESPMKTKDVPCTVSLQWFIRDSKLHCHANMRSSDVWLGLPYDWFNFSMISLYLLLILRQIDSRFFGISLGQLTVTAGSQHLYEENWEAADKILTEPVATPQLDPILAVDFTNPGDFLAWLKIRSGSSNPLCGLLRRT